MSDPADQTKTPRVYPALHCLVLLPLLGALVVLVARIRVEAEAERAELKEAFLNQCLAATVLVVHAVLQVGIEAVGWLWNYTEEMGMAVEGSWVPAMLSVSSSLNLGAGVIEWGFFVVAGLRAATGRSYLGWSSSKREDSPGVDQGVGPT